MSKELIDNYLNQKPLYDMEQEIKEASEQTTNIVVTITKKTKGEKPEQVKIDIDVTDIFTGNNLSKIGSIIENMLYKK